MSSVSLRPGKNLLLGYRLTRFIGSDDDSGGKRNARLRFECKADGAYHLIATGLGHPEGDFQLKIAAE